MITPPPEVKKGELITAAWANRLRESVLARTPLQTADIGLKETPSGYKPWIKRKGSSGGGGAGVEDHPWKISKNASETEGSIDLSVYPGTVSSILPLNIFNKITVSISGTHYIKLKCESDGKTINAVTVMIDSLADSSSDLVASNGPPAEVYITIGVIVDGTILQIETDVIEINPVVAFVESRVPPTLGAEPFIRWWRWGRSK